MMTPEMPLERALRELWAFHQFFMRLGFTADEIWLAQVSDAGVLCAGVHVARGGEEFNAAVCVVDMEALRHAWGPFIVEMNSLPNAKRDQVYRAHLTRAHELLVGLVRKGGCFRTAVDDVSKARRALGSYDA